MPLYEFECRQCQTVFEELVPMGSTGEGLACPACAHPEVRKRMSTFYGRSASGGGSYAGVGGQRCDCGGDCGSCGSGCSCRH